MNLKDDILTQKNFTNNGSFTSGLVTQWKDRSEYQLLDWQISHRSWLFGKNSIIFYILLLPLQDPVRIHDATQNGTPSAFFPSRCATMATPEFRGSQSESNRDTLEQCSQDQLKTLVWPADWSNRVHSTSHLGEIKSKEVCFNHQDPVLHHHGLQHTTHVSPYLVYLLRQARMCCGPLRRTPDPYGA